MRKKYLHSKDPVTIDLFVSKALEQSDMGYLEHLLTSMPMADIRFNNELVDYNHVFPDGTTPLWWLTLAALLGRPEALHVVLRNISILQFNFMLTNSSGSHFHDFSVKTLMALYAKSTYCINKPFFSFLPSLEELPIHPFYQGIFIDNIDALNVSFFPAEFNGLSPLHWAIELGRLNVAQFLWSFFRFRSRRPPGSLPKCR